MNVPTGVFTAFLGHLTHFARYALLYGCCTSVFVACLASLMAVLTISTCCCVPLLRRWRRTSFVIKLRCRRGNKTSARQCERERRSVHFLGWDASFCQKRTKKNALATDTMTALSPEVYVSLRICWLTCKLEFCCSYRARKHINGP